MTDSRITGASSRLPSRKRIEDAVRAELERFKESESLGSAPETINSSRCRAFAKAVLERLGLSSGPKDTSGPEEGHAWIENCKIDGAWSMGRWGGHCWIYASHLGLHFDAGAPRGTPDWQDLSFYQRRRDDLGFPIGPVGEDILSAPKRIEDPDRLRWVEKWAGACHVYAHRPDGSRRPVPNPDATYTPTIWVKGQLPLPALKDCLNARCPGREDWREWLRKENEARTERGFDTYHDWLSGGIRDPVIVDGQGPFIWDGTRRTGWAIDQGKGAIPAYLGVEPGPQSAISAATNGASKGAVPQEVTSE